MHRWVKVCAPWLVLVTVAAAQPPAMRIERLLVGQLRDRDPVRQRAACWALCVWSRWRPRLFATLCNELDHPDPAIRRAFTSALGQFEDRADDVLRLLRRARQRDPTMLVPALRALQALGPAGARDIADVVACLRDRDERVRFAAARALGSLRPDLAPAVRSLRQALRAPRSQFGGRIVLRSSCSRCAIRNRGAVDRGAVLSRLRDLQDPDPVARRRAVRKLVGLVGSELPDDLASAVVPSVVSASRDPHPAVRKAAVAALPYLTRDFSSFLAFVLARLEDRIRACERRPSACWRARRSVSEQGSPRRSPRRCAMRARMCGASLLERSAPSKPWEQQPCRSCSRC